MNYTLSRRAAGDLEAIYGYIAQESRRYANSFADRVVEQCAIVGKNPEAYPIWRIVEGGPLRRKVFGSI